MGSERVRALRLTAEALLVIVLFLALLGAAFVLFPGSFAWLSRNEEVGGGGMQVTIEGTNVSVTYYKAVGDGDFIPLSSPEDMFSGLLPGDTVRIKAEYVSGANKAVDLALRLTVPEGGEIPLVIDGRYYYLSTQLKLDEQDVFLLTPPDDRLAYDTEQAPTATEVGEVTVPAGGTAELVFTVLFVNYPDLDQSAYQGFGTLGSGEACYRRRVSVVK